MTRGGCFFSSYVYCPRVTAKYSCSAFINSRTRLHYVFSFCVFSGRCLITAPNSVNRHHTVTSCDWQFTANHYIFAPSPLKFRTTIFYNGTIA